MSTDVKLFADSTALVVIDVQERLAAAMPAADRARCVRKIDMLLEAARLFQMPVVVSEQYPKGLGHTVPELVARLDTFEQRPPIAEKTDFDAMGSSEFADALDHAVTHEREGAIRTVLVTGMESHVCVYQTARGLLGGGYHVQIPWDATCSRVPEDVQIARELWALMGAVVTSTEAVLFDLLGSARHPHFKAISKLVR